METVPTSSTKQRHSLVCPITLDVYQDPVLAGDGYVYERAAIAEWMEQQGTSPFTRQPLNVADLYAVENNKELDQSYESQPVTYSIERRVMPFLSPPTMKSNADDERRTVFKQNCNVKRILLTVPPVILIISVFVIALSIFLTRTQSNSFSSDTSTSTKKPVTLPYPSTNYILPNNCTLPRIVSLFSWSNAPSFNFTFYSKQYQAVSSKTIITFALRHDPFFWCLDNVSVIDTSSKVELITNGHFEDNPSDGFIRCNSYGSTSTTFFMPPPYSFTVQRLYCDGSVSMPDYLSQTLNTKIGQVYQVSFWLQNKGHGPNGAQVVMSY